MRQWLLGLLALSLLALMALCVGRVGIPPLDVVRILLDVAPGDPQGHVIVWSIRLPRVLAALLIGGALAASGAAYQGVFRNPLVSPDILAVSTGASLGAVLGIFLRLDILWIQLLAFLAGLVAVFLVYLVGNAARRHETTLALVLAGVAIGALLGALVSLLKVLADPYNQLPAITFWLLGSLAAVDARDLVTTAPLVGAGLLVLLLLRWRLNLLALADDEARAMGVATHRLRPLLIAAATLMSASVVAISGIVGWVGLVIPHIARLLVGPDFRRLLPASLLMGAGYLLLIDTAARSMAGVEVPLGILTAILGAPFFLFLLLRAGSGWR